MTIVAILPPSEEARDDQPDGRDNGDLMALCMELGYLGSPGAPVLDATYRHGKFWTKVRPENLTTNDLDFRFGEHHEDFRRIPLEWLGAFAAVVLDPPYKLNGTPDQGGPADADERYGVEEPARWQDRMELCRAGIRGCALALAPGGFLLVKCQAQVCSGQVRWQDRDFADVAEGVGLRLVDRFDLLGYRKQPDGRRQVHAARNHSTLLVCQAPKR